MLVTLCPACQVDRDLLRVYLRGAPSLLFPSFELQKHIQRKIFG